MDPPVTAELGQSADPVRLIAGDADALHRTVALWRARAEDAERSAAALRPLRTVPDWAGEAADAYERRVTAGASRWEAMASAFRAAHAALEEFAAALDAARARAGDAVDLWNQAEAMDAAATTTPAFPAPDRQPLRGLEPRAEARSILDDARSALAAAADRAAAALRAAIATPGLDADEWLAVLTGCISAGQMLDAIAGADGPSLAAVLRAKPALADVLAQAEPSAVAPWWAALSDAQRNALVFAAPAVIGNLGGVAYAARDRANRLWLDAQLAEARAEVAEAEGAPTFGGPADRYAGAVAYADRLEAARARVAGLENIAVSLVVPEGKASRYLVSLTADAPPLAALSIGDLDTAGTVSFAIPGMGTTTEQIGDWVRCAQSLLSEQDRVDSAESHAVVAWVGYKTPPVPFSEGGFDVFSNELAQKGGTSLAEDLRSIAAVRGDAEISVVAHSYGTTAASFALTQDDVNVDAFVTLGSAGLPEGIEDASDLHAGHVFAGQAQDVSLVDPAGGDRWAWVGRTSPHHPVNPMAPEFGAQTFDVSGGDGLNAVLDHVASTPEGAGYLDSGTESLRNTALATTGKGAAVSVYTPPSPTPFEQAITRGLTHGYGT
ncbi:alpha/beta hydrolase [Microbacterium sp. BWR-S6Y]|uniref:alpha/beta hydrolase n=1 Tax=Microbacterium sp. BWR-S6Y TaxID=3232073 RepID=UPI0035292F6F